MKTIEMICEYLLRVGALLVCILIVIGACMLIYNMVRAFIKDQKES